MHTRLAVAPIIFALAHNASSGTMGAITPNKEAQWVGSVTAGPLWSNAGFNQTFNLTPDIEKTYAAQRSNKVLGSVELFAGLQKKICSQWFAQLGLVGATTGNARMQGEIWDDADPQFNNYSYQYKIQNSRIGVKGALLFDKGYAFIPWVNASLNVGFNRSHYFINNPLIFEAIPNNNFSNNTTTSFVYTLGAGVQRKIGANWQIGVGYEFADWGKSHLNAAVDQTLNNGLALNHLYTQGVLFNLTYIT